MLPPELFPEVCQHLQIRDILSLSHVSQDLQLLVSDDIFRSTLLKHCPFYDLDTSPHKTWKECVLSYVSRDKKICADVSETEDHVISTDEPFSTSFTSLSDTYADSLLSLGQSISLEGSKITFDDLQRTVDVSQSEGDKPADVKSTSTFKNGIYRGFHGIAMTLPASVHAHMTAVESPEVLAVLTGWGFTYQKLMVKYKNSPGLDPDYIGEKINQLDRVFVSAGNVFLKSVSNWMYYLQDGLFIPVVFQPQSTREYPFLLCYDGRLMHFSGTTVEVFHVDLESEKRGGKCISFTHSNSGFSGNLYKLVQVAENPRYAIEYNINRTICGVWDFKHMTYMRRQYNDNRKKLQLVGVEGEKVCWKLYSREYMEGRLGRKLEWEEEVVQEYGDL